MKNVAISAPIGVFDSGVGGLTVLRALKNQLPNESFIYLGDMARVPYGTKSAPAIIRYTLRAASVLAAQDIKLLVVACHTASTLAISALNNQFPSLPLVGMIEPGARAACLHSKNKHIAVIATEATVKAQGYQSAICQVCPQAQVVAQACSVFVALAEEGWVNGSIAESVARKYLAPIFNHHTPRPDCLLLGCTHFPPLLSAIQKIIGENVHIVDPAIETAFAVKHILGEKNLLNPQAPADATTDFLVTDSPERFAKVAEQFLETQLHSSQIQLVQTLPFSTE